MLDGRLAVVAGDRRALADLAGDVEQELRLAGCRKLMIAAAWADAHSTKRWPSTFGHPAGDPSPQRNS